MLKLVSFLVVFALTTGAGMFVDYKNSARWAGKAGADALTFPDYLAALPGRLSKLGDGAAEAAGLPTRLSDMLPKAPKGWKARPVAAEDIDGFLPKASKKADKTAVAAVKSLALADAGAEVAALTYEKDDRKLIIKAVRYPDAIFTSPDSLQERLDLQMKTAEFRGTEFATVRGLDVTEDLLPEGFRGRMFLADVGAQIHLRILAPKRMSDGDLIEFLETLHVKAMNADVVDKVAGLGEVPVIVLASALGDEARTAYLADVAARAADEAADRAALLAEVMTVAAAAPAAEAPAGGGFLGTLFGASDTPAMAEAVPTEVVEKTVTCKTGKDGVKRCTVAAEAGE